jgi:hypothetical protein
MGFDKKGDHSTYQDYSGQELSEAYFSAEELTAMVAPISLHQ